MNTISHDVLAIALSGKEVPLVLDVRRGAARIRSGQQIPGALWRDPALWLDWKDDIAQRGPVVLYCAHGQEISQSLTTALQVMGSRAVFLEGGFAAWESRRGACVRLTPEP